MSAAKHTPGPWQVFGVRRRLGAEDCQQVGPDGCAIAFLPIGRDLPGALADARLIAAAPELLETLRRAEVTLRTNDAWVGLADECKRAITKATGGQQ